MTDVACTVSNCKFWANDNVCEADKITVTGNAPGRSDRLDAGRMGATDTARHSGETQCSTFKQE